MFISEAIEFSYHLNETFKQGTWLWLSLSLGYAHTSSLNTHYFLIL